MLPHTRPERTHKARKPSRRSASLAGPSHCDDAKSDPEATDGALGGDRHRRGRPPSRTYRHHNGSLCVPNVWRPLGTYRRTKSVRDQSKVPPSRKSYLRSPSPAHAPAKDDQASGPQVRSVVWKLASRNLTSTGSFCFGLDCISQTGKSIPMHRRKAQTAIRSRSGFCGLEKSLRVSRACFLSRSR